MVGAHFQLVVACALVELCGSLGVLQPQQEPCLLAYQVPSVRSCAPRQKPLVVVAGEGKTGTESLSTALAMLGLKVAHFESLIQCCHVVYANASVPDVTVLGIDTGLPGRGSNPICQTTARHSGHTCRDVSWDFQYQPYIDLVGRIKTLPSLEYDDFDWCVFDDYDVVADVPIPFIAPYLYQAYGPGTKVINTVRAAGDWAARRAGWDAHLDLGDLAPLGWIFADSIAKGAMAGKPTNAVALYNRSKSAATYAYIAERALIHCTVQPVDLMELDLLTGVSDPPTLWASLAAFLGLSTAGLDTSQFPHEIPGVCHSSNVRATYILADANATYDPDGAPLPYAARQYKVFNDYPPALQFLRDLQGCNSHVGRNNITTTDLDVDENWRRIFERTGEQLLGAGRGGDCEGAHASASAGCEGPCSGDKAGTAACRSHVAWLVGQIEDALGDGRLLIGKTLQPSALAQVLQAAGEPEAAALLFNFTSEVTHATNEGADRPGAGA